MRVLLVALNAKYVQTNLALRYLRGAIKNEFSDIVLKEATINEPLSRLTGEIYEVKADVIGFSCYIWNLSEILRIIRDLRLVLPKVRFVLGGPEVTFETQELMYKNPELDAVIQGEGEGAFLELLRTWKAGRDPDNVPGVVWRHQDKIISNPERIPLMDLAQLPNPYVLQEKLDNRLVYVETTRGCPFNCQYCLSSVGSGVRFLEPEHFRQIFIKLLTYGARTIKFVDRTFNVSKEHAFRILDIVQEEVQNLNNLQGIRIHCEMAGELLDEEWLAYLKKYPQDLLQLEIGVQSTYRPTLESINRFQHFEIWQKYLQQLQLTTNIPLHLDLIAGLPEENWDNFRISFNDVYKVQPNMLQLGFLKVLKGSGLRQRARQYGLIYQSDPPYTILQTKKLSYLELLQLKRMEILLDKYYNSGRFLRSLRWVISLFPSAFDFYDYLAQFWHEQNWFGLPWKEKALFERFWLFLEDFRKVNPRKIREEKWETLRDALRFDYYYWERPSVVPDYLLPGGKMSTEKTKSRSLTELKSLACEKFVKGSKGISVSQIESMDRQQWFRCTALAYFSTPFMKDLTWDEELEQDRKDNRITKDNNPVWYLFFYQKGRVWATQINA
ncbi:MAG: B12-binding domain-containing radical SAM protein [Desulfitobacteriaceae bacterium]